MWMKWHHEFAYGDEKEEHWRDLGPCKTMEEAASLVEEECAELSREYEWSDKYRGIAYEIVEAPPGRGTARSCGGGGQAVSTVGAPEAVLA